MNYHIKKIREALYRCKQWVKLMFIYPRIQRYDDSYNRYWHERKLHIDSLNDFQKDRAALSAKLIQEHASIMDIGCGNGAVLRYINAHKPVDEMIGVDMSEDALALAQANQVHAIKADISKDEELAKLPHVDYIFLFEVIEHVPHSERLVDWAISHARKGVFLSVPNTGFFSHRFRMLFGRFPLQWRAHPSEHVRFWTLIDMKWWLQESKYPKAEVYGYQGIPILNVIWPALFAAGLFVVIKK